MADSCQRVPLHSSAGIRCAFNGRCVHMPTHAISFSSRFTTETFRHNRTPTYNKVHTFQLSSSISDGASLTVKVGAMHPLVESP